MVDDPQLALAWRRARLAALAEDALVGRVHHHLGALGVDAAPAQQLARLLGDEDVAVGHRRADPLLGADQANQRVARRPIEEGGEELGEGVVEVEDQRHAAQLRPQGREDERVGHVVDLDQVEAAAAIEGADLAGGAGEEAGVALEVGAGAAAGLVLRGPVRGDAALADAELGLLAEADAVDVIAAFGQRPCLALDPRVDGKVRVVDHADAQGCGARLTPRAQLLPAAPKLCTAAAVSAMCQSSIAGKTGSEQDSLASRSATGSEPRPRPRSA